METIFKAAGNNIAEIYFLDGPLPDGYRCDFDALLFNAPETLTIQTLNGWQSFYALRKDRKLARARVHFHIEDGVAISPFKNPFGSFEFSESIWPKELYEFIHWTENRLKEKGVEKIIIKGYPEIYNADGSALLSTFLLNQGYNILRAELSACLRVNTDTLFSNMSSFSKRKSGQIKRSNLRFSQMPVQRIKEVYDFLTSCQDDRMPSLSTPFPQMKTFCDNFPDRFVLFGLFDVGALVAASIAVKVNKSVLFNFYSGYSKQYSSLSPEIKLTEGIYEYCQQDKIKVFDLGNSSFRGKPNFGLLDLKTSLGASPTTKYTFEKKLA